jgi:hypothetical protein
MGGGSPIEHDARRFAHATRPAVTSRNPIHGRKEGRKEGNRGRCSESLFKLPSLMSDVEDGWSFELPGTQLELVGYGWQWDA